MRGLLRRDHHPHGNAAEQRHQHQLGGIPFCFVMNAEVNRNRAQVSNLLSRVSREKIKNLCLSVDCSRGSANAQNRRADSGRYFYVQRARVYLCTKQKVAFFFGTYIYI